MNYETFKKAYGKLETALFLAGRVERRLLVIERTKLRKENPEHYKDYWKGR